MMNKTHAVSGAAAYIAAAPAFGFAGQTLALGVLVCAGAATLPDLDHPGSKPSRILFGPFRTRLSRLFVRHRGPTHTLWAVVALTALLWPLAGISWWTVALVLGWTAHIAGDCLTVGNPRQPMRLLPPLRVVLRGPIHAGGRVERIVIFPALVLFCGWAFVGYPVSV